MSALFPGLTVDQVKNKAKGVQVKKLKVQFNPSQVQINAIGSKLAYIQDTTAEKKSKKEKLKVLIPTGATSYQCKLYTYYH